MNSYSNYRVFILGSWIKNGHDDIWPYEGTWAELLNDPDFITFREKHSITDEQLVFIKRGFHGLELEEPEVKEEIEHSDDKFPFGTHAGKPLHEVPDKYYLFLLNQPFIIKYPSVLNYAKQVRSRMNTGAASPQEVKQILHKIL